MSELVADCPRCKSKSITFDLLAQNYLGSEYRWQRWYEVFCICRHCHKATTFVLSQKEIGHSEFIQSTPISDFPHAVNRYFEVEDFVSLKDVAAEAPPEHLPPEIEAAFKEGASALAVGCPNAAAAMFRLCVDHATKGLLPNEEVPGLTQHIRRTLAPRLTWLFQSGRLPKGLEDLSTCIREDGNDGVHDGSIGMPDAEDILDFTVALLERLYTEAKRLDIAKARREARRKG